MGIVKRIGIASYHNQRKRLFSIGDCARRRRPAEHSCAQMPPAFGLPAPANFGRMQDTTTSRPVLQTGHSEVATPVTSSIRSRADLAGRSPYQAQRPSTRGSERGSSSWSGWQRSRSGGFASRRPAGHVEPDLWIAVCFLHRRRSWETPEVEHRFSR